MVTRRDIPYRGAPDTESTVPTTPENPEATFPMQHQAHRHHHGSTAVRPVSDARLHASDYPATATAMNTASPNSMTTFMFWSKHQRPRETFG